MSIDAVQTIGIVGSGQMGRGIAQVAVTSGFEVFLYDVSDEALKFAEEFIKKQLDKAVTKGKLEESDKDQAISRLKIINKLEDISACQLVIEAATENKSVKFEIFKQLDSVLPPEAILATNTSSISITELASVTQRAEKIAGMHFMNPVPVMKLVEGISGLETSEETFKTVEDVAVKMNKVFIKAKDIPGFAVNRILMPMINEAVYTLYEGVATVEDIDQAMKLGCAQPMGPLELADFIGLDTCLAIMNVLFDGLGDSKYRPCPLLKQYVAAGRFGRKNKRGFYKYD